MLSVCEELVIDFSGENLVLNLSVWVIFVFGKWGVMVDFRKENVSVKVVLEGMRGNVWKL